MNKQTGFTLIEIMVALLIGLIVIGATLSIYLASITATRDILRSARLNYDLDSALVLMVNDIRRAGYWGGAIVGSDATVNPFTQLETNLNILNTNKCVLYGYDFNSSGSTSNTPVDGTEYFGFKWDDTNKYVQMRLSGTTTTDCSDGDWSTLNITSGSQQIEVTALTFTPSKKCLIKRTGGDVPCGTPVTGERVVETLEITISMSGRVKNDPTTTKTVTDSVKIRNDRIYVQ